MDMICPYLALSSWSLGFTLNVLAFFRLFIIEPSSVETLLVHIL